MTLLVGSSGARDLDTLIADAKDAPRDVDLVEVRLDRFADPEGIDVAELRRAIGRPALLTLRSDLQGGGFLGDLGTRSAILALGDAAGFEWIDLEADVAARIPRGKARRLVSFHGKPTDAAGIAGRVAALRALDADAVKVAVDVDDPERALRFVLEAQAGAGGVVAIAMGEAGAWLRPLAGRFGMPLLFAALHGSRKTAAGQLTVADAIETYRVKAIGPATQVFAVAGADVAKSISPRVHNAVFRALGRDAAYVALPAAGFAPIAAVAAALPLAGLSVTAPFKTDALALAEVRDDDARAIGAANTLVRRDDGSFAASNTDAAGFAAALRAALAEPELARELCVGRSFEILDRIDATARPLLDRPLPERSLVWGTGGAARAIAFALAKGGSKVMVTGRSQPRATALVLQLGRGIEAVAEGRAQSLKFDLLVKAIPDTPGDELVPDPFDFSPQGAAADVVYRPLDTDFLLAARRRGRLPIPGIMMFSEQAVLQACAFTGAPAAELRPIVTASIRSTF